MFSIAKKYLNFMNEILKNNINEKEFLIILLYNVNRIKINEYIYLS